MKPIIKLLRVKHYIKNMLIFLPLFFSKNLFEKCKLQNVIMGVIAFSLTCSAIYILNDICDSEKDKLHPKKKYRPIASGEVEKWQAVILMIILFLCSGIILYMSRVQITVIILFLIYVLINILYSFIMKNIPILDVFILASFYVIRVLIGGGLAGVEVSSWLFLTVAFLSLYLGLGKRSGEMSTIAGETRTVLKRYTCEWVKSHMMLCLTLGLAFYSLWALEQDKRLVYTVPLVVMICMTYNYDVDKGGETR